MELVLTGDCIKLFAKAVTSLAKVGAWLRFSLWRVPLARV